MKSKLNLPWKLHPETDLIGGFGGIQDAEGWDVAETFGNDAAEVLQLTRHVVACVNACAGIPTEWLERIVTKGLTISDMTHRDILEDIGGCEHETMATYWAGQNDE